MSSRVEHDPTRVETPEEVVRYYAERSTGCVCPTGVALLGPTAPPCLPCRCRAALEKRPIGTAADGVKRREATLAQFDEMLARCRAKKERT